MHRFFLETGWMVPSDQTKPNQTNQTRLCSRWIILILIFVFIYILLLSSILSFFSIGLDGRRGELATLESSRVESLLFCLFVSTCNYHH